MTVILSAGGLGNQLFAWNFAHYLIVQENLSKVKIAFDLPPQDYELGIARLRSFCNHNISIVPYSQNIKSLLRVIDFSSKKSKLMSRIVSKQTHFLSENLNHFSLSNLNKKNFLIRGFFQNVHFKSTIPLVLDELSYHFRESSKSLSELARELYPSLISNQNIVVHARRGDYLDNYETLGVLSKRYFVQQSRNYKRVILFSDDSNFVRRIEKEHENWSGYGKELNQWETLYLLGSAKNLVISNSTFSWWAGQTVLRNGGQVLAPRPWFRQPQFERDIYQDERFVYRNSDFENNLEF